MATVDAVTAIQVTLTLSGQEAETLLDYCATMEAADFRREHGLIYELEEKIGAALGL